MKPNPYETVRLGDYCYVKGGKRLPKGRPFSEQITPHPYIRVSDFKGGSVDLSELKFVYPEDQKKIARYTIGKNDLYISIAGTLGLVGTIPDQLDGAQLTENAAKIVLKNGEFDRDFLKYCLSSSIIQKQINFQKGTGGGVPKLALFRIEQIEIPKPDIKEQNKIAEILSTWDRAIEFSKLLMKTKQRRREAVLNEIFESAEGREVPLAEIVSTFVGGASLSDPDYCSSGVQVLSKKVSNPTGTAILEKDDVKYCSEKFAEKNLRAMVDGQFLLTSLRSLDAQNPNIGFIVRPPEGERFLLAQGAYGFRIDETACDKEYLIALSSWRKFRHQIVRRVVGGTQVHLRGDDFLQARLVLPSLKYQKKVAHALRSINLEMFTSLKLINKIRSQKSGLMQQLLTGKIRVKA